MSLDKSPDLFDGLDSPEFGNRSQHQFSTDNNNVKPSLVNDTSTDMGFNLLANQLKVDVKATDSPPTPKKELQTIIDDPLSNHHNRSSTPSEYETSSSSSRRRSSSSNSSSSVVVKKQATKLSASDIRFRKIELLRIFQELEEKNIRVSTRYTIHSDLDEMEQEYEVLKSLQLKKNGITLYKSFMLNAVSAVEFMNESYNPFDFHLHGWTEHVSLGIDDYNDVLGELYEKYKHVGRKMEPELKLMFMLTASATAFHTSHAVLGDGRGNFIRNNPKVVNRVAKEFVKDRTEQPTTVFERNHTINGPDPNAFLARMKEKINNNQKDMTYSHFAKNPNITVHSNPVSDDILNGSVTTTTRRKQKNNVTIQI